MSVGGISAGGAISLILQHMARDAGVALRLCMATVPPASTALTYASPTESPYPSFHEFAYGPILPFASIKLFGEYCFPRDQLYVPIAGVPPSLLCCGRRGRNMPLACTPPRKAQWEILPTFSVRVGLYGH